MVPLSLAPLRLVLLGEQPQKPKIPAASLSPCRTRLCCSTMHLHIAAPFRDCTAASACSQKVGCLGTGKILQCSCQPAQLSTHGASLLQVLNPMLVYPAHMSFPIMDNSGLPPKPEGMLLVKVLRGEKLKGKEVVGKIDPFVQVGMLCHCTGLAVDALSPLQAADMIASPRRVAAEACCWQQPCLKSAKYSLAVVLDINSFCSLLP